jgi:hypothetical protein
MGALACYRQLRIVVADNPTFREAQKEIELEVFYVLFSVN